MPAVAASALGVPHSRIRELAEIAIGMQGVLRLYFGESNLPTPDFIKQAAVRAMADGFTYYTSNAGLLSTREALSRYYARAHGVEIDPETRIVITASGVQALHVAIRCLLDPGDEAIILTPAWPNGSSIVEMVNARARQVAQPYCGGRYSIDFDALAGEVSPRTKMLLYTSPSNPLGWVATQAEQLGLLEFARRHGLWLMADEVYERLNYEGAPGEAVPSILRLAERDDAVVVVQSFSKSYCMTGWRVGWVLTRPDLAARVTQMNEFIISHAPSFAQRAAETALEEGERFIVEMVERLRANRDYCAEQLTRMPGVSVPATDGAFYLFPQIAGMKDSFGFCKDLLLQTKLGLAPGVAFGAGGEGSIRICYAAERGILEPAMERLRTYLKA
jgi:hypothetical protein